MANWQQLSQSASPFSDYRYFHALEVSDCATTAKGWTPHHLVFKPDELEETVSASLPSILPLYIKSHSWGEYVFDWGWAEAYEKHGLDYYPKLVSTAPFTPVTTDKLLSSSHCLFDAFNALTKECVTHNLHSWHLLYCAKINDEDEKRLAAENIYYRNTVQFHWFNKNYQSFDDFLSNFTARKRKNTKKERRSISEQQVDIRRIKGKDISRQELAFFYLSYQLTYLKKGHQPHLTFEFFQTLFSTMADNLLLVIASKNKTAAETNASENQTTDIAAALFFYDDTTLYGRYWGCTEAVKNLHFELCYYQGIEFCIENNLTSFNPGTQGEHKIQRGFEPVLTHSYHWVKHPLFRDAIKDFCQRETKQMQLYMQQCRMALPFKAIEPVRLSEPELAQAATLNNKEQEPDMTLPFSQACENNKAPILAELATIFTQSKQVLEIGSGSGQHGCYFARNLPHLTWQCSDLAINHQGINLRIDAEPVDNIRRPIVLDLHAPWPLTNTAEPLNFDGMFTANTLHIVSWPLVQNFFVGVGEHLANDGLLCIYGPFNYQGKFTSASNANFDLWLKDRDENSGIRHFEDIVNLAEKVGLALLADHEMPANNRLLVFKKA